MRRPQGFTLRHGLFPYCRTVGIPTGSPLTPILANFYLMPLDQILSEDPAGFYRRYGDDILFIHPDQEVFSRTIEKIPACLDALGLTVKKEKWRVSCWNGSGTSVPGAQTSKSTQHAFRTCSWKRLISEFGWKPPYHYWSSVKMPKAKDKS